jgi:hypothetical protein
MILETLFISTPDDNLQTESVNILLGTPNSLGISTSLSGIMATGTPFKAFAGISGGRFGPPLGVGGFGETGGAFNSAAVAFLEDVAELTFVVGAQAAPGGTFTGSNSITVQGICQILFNPGI